MIRGISKLSILGVLILTFINSTNICKSQSSTESRDCDAPLIFFEDNSIEILDSYKHYLYEIDTTLDDNPELKLNIEGHRDFWERKSNIGLERALEVKKFLGVIGIDTSRLRIVDYGCTQANVDSLQIVSVNIETQKKLKRANRRVSFSIQF